MPDMHVSPLPSSRSLKLGADLPSASQAMVIGERRVNQPYGMHGGGAGERGCSYWVRKTSDGGQQKIKLKPSPKFAYVARFSPFLHRQAHFFLLLFSQPFGRRSPHHPHPRRRSLRRSHRLASSSRLQARAVPSSQWQRCGFHVDAGDELRIPIACTYVANRNSFFPRVESDELETSELSLRYTSHEIGQQQCSISIAKRNPIDLVACRMLHPHQRSFSPLPFPLPFLFPLAATPSLFKAPILNATNALPAAPIA